MTHRLDAHLLYTRLRGYQWRDQNRMKGAKMIDKISVLIIAMCFFVSGFVIGWKLGEAFGKRSKDA